MIPRGNLADRIKKPVPAQKYIAYVRFLLPQKGIDQASDGRIIGRRVCRLPVRQDSLYTFLTVLAALQEVVCDLETQSAVFFVGFPDSQFIAGKYSAMICSSSIVSPPCLTGYPSSHKYGFYSKGCKKNENSANKRGGAPWHRP